MPWLSWVEVIGTLLLTGAIAVFAGKQWLANRRLADLQERMMELNQPSVISHYLRHERLLPVAMHSGTEGWGVRLMNPSRIPLHIHSASIVTTDESGVFTHHQSVELKEYSEVGALVGTNQLPMTIDPGHSVEVWVELSLSKLTPRSHGVMLLLGHAEGMERVSLRPAHDGPDPMTAWEDAGYRLKLGGFPKGSLGNQYIEYRKKHPDKYGDESTWFPKGEKA